LDETFREFYYWCKANDVPVIIVSRCVEIYAVDFDSATESERSGMAPLIRAVLSKHIGDEEANEIEIISNDVDIQADGKWQIKYRHPSR
jgi:2-hydroxy-3-keto-5-methylthiopentenyl-1-phosphate phosphatase